MLAKFSLPFTNGLADSACGGGKRVVVILDVLCVFDMVFILQNVASHVDRFGALMGVDMQARD